MTWLLDIFVPGRPAPQGSIRAIVHKSTGRAVAIKDNNARQKSWRQDVRDAVTEAWGTERAPLDGPVEVAIDFVMPRPASTPKRSTPPAIKKPDGDKLERAVFDSLTHVVWTDDSRAVSSHWTKRLAEIGETPGARIRVAAYEPIPASRCSDHTMRAGGSWFSVLVAGCPTCVPRVAGTEPAPVQPQITSPQQSVIAASNTCPHPIRVDGPGHSWRFDGDDLYIVCVGCDEMRDALTGRVLRAGSA